MYCINASSHGDDISSFFFHYNDPFNGSFGGKDKTWLSNAISMDVSN